MQTVKCINHDCVVSTAQLS